VSSIFWAIAKIFTCSADDSPGVIEIGVETSLYPRVIKCVQTRWPDWNQL